jgi:hypothetical protein
MIKAMTRKVTQLFFCILLPYLLSAQGANYTPEMVTGHRSLSYKHLVSYDFKNTVAVNNLTLFDTEHQGDSNNVYFIRNTVTFRLDKKLSVNAAFGMKNPGTFATISFQYYYAKNDFSASYSVGSTYQAGFTLEQSVTVDYAPSINKNLSAYFNLLVIVNLKPEEYNRGIQQLKAGLKQDDLMYGLGANFDQFNNGYKTLLNIGVFIKYTIKK